MTVPILWSRRRLLQLAGLATIGVLQAVFALVVAIGASHLLVGAKDTLSPALLMPAVIAATGGLVALRVLQRRYGEAFALAYVAELRCAFISHVLRLPADAKAPRFGLIMTRVVNDLSAIKLWLASGLVAMIVAAAMLATLATALLFLELRMAAALLAAIGLWSLPVLASFFPLKWRIRESRRQRGRIAGRAGAMVGASLTLLSLGRHGASVRAIARLSAKMNAALIGRATFSGLLRSSGDIVFPAVALMLAAGGLGGRVLDAEMLGVLVMVSGLTAVQLNAVALALEYRLAHNVALARLRAVLAIPALALDRGSTLQRINGGRRLSVENVSVGEDQRAVSFDVQTGEVVALDGASDSEVADLFLAIAGLRRATQGTISIDGRDAGAIRPRDWWRAVTLLSASLPTIAGPIGDAACLGAPSSVDVQERQRVLQRFGLMFDEAAMTADVTAPPYPERSAAIRASRAVLRRASLVLVNDAPLFDRPQILHALLDELRSLGVTVVLSPKAPRAVLTDIRRIDLGGQFRQAA